MCYARHMFWRRSKKGKVYVGLSGGVDSSVSAALLKRAGYEVTGVFIRIALPGYPCTAGEDRREALRAATHLGISFVDIDLSEVYKQAVFEPSLKEFAQGRTPNPDALCNREIKFGLFYRFAREHGADFVATGHYAQIQNNAGEQQLFAGKDSSKDQSYFLWAVPEQELDHILFPVGHLQKSEVRALAQKFGLPNAARKDSQGLCFLGDIGIEDMLTKELPHQRGVVFDEEGHSIGEHHGAVLYTLGQRHGFTIVAQGNNGLPHYVVAKSIKDNTVTVSTSKTPRGNRTRLIISNENWLGTVKTGHYFARFRYRAELIPAVLEKEDQGSVIVLKGAHLAPEGQSLVLYQGERCIGGGIIAEATIEN